MSSGNPGAGGLTPGVPAGFGPSGAGADPTQYAHAGSQAQAALAPGVSETEHHHSPYLAHHFDDLQQQKDADVLGMWAFLATEVMFFGGLFTAFIIYRMNYPQAFIESSHHMHTWIGCINTGVLLVSSFTVALAVSFAQEGKSKLVAAMLGATILLASLFLIIKAYEYYSEYKAYLIPFSESRWIYDPQELAKVAPDVAEHEAHTQHGRTLSNARPARIYFSLYFIMTGVHAFHMLIGIGIFAVVGWKALKGAYAPEYYNPVEISGLYWHFVDLVWIFLFPILYLL